MRIASSLYAFFVFVNKTLTTTTGSAGGKNLLSAERQRSGKSSRRDGAKNRPQTQQRAVRWPLLSKFGKFRGMHAHAHLSVVVVVWVLLMNTKNAYSDEEMRKFQDIDFDADWVERQVSSQVV